MLCLSAAACGTNTETDDDIQCAVSTRPIADGTTVRGLGFSARDVLAWAPRTETQRLRWWHEYSDILLGDGVEAESLEWSLARGVGSAAVVTSACSEDDRAVTKLRIPARLTLTLSNGRSMNLEATISTVREGFAVVDALGNTHSLDEIAVALGPAEIVARSVRIAIDEHGSSGRFHVNIERRRGFRIISSPNLSIFSWPADSACDVESIARPLSDSDPSWLSLATHASEQAWAGFDASGTRTDSVSIETPGVACTDETGVVRLPATVRLMRSEAGELALSNHFEPRGDGAMWTLRGTRPWDDFAAYFPSLVSAAGRFEHIELSAEVNVTAQIASGFVSVIGFKGQPCKPECFELGCAGCSPVTEDVLVHVRLSPANGQ